MTTIKTAISIDEEIFNEVELMTKKLHISRSRFYSQAAKHMIERKDNIDLLQKINAAYDSLQDDGNEKARRQQEKKYYLKRIPDKWK